METVTAVEKEEIRSLKFVPEEVLSTTDEIKIRRHELDRAMVLGNGYHAKAKIIFETLEGTRKIETHIWAATEKFVTLKGGILIPIHSIRKVIT